MKIKNLAIKQHNNQKVRVFAYSGTAKDFLRKIAVRSPYTFISDVSNKKFTF